MGRREDIVSCARELFEEKGLSRTSVQSIADRMGVARSLFYHYFPSVPFLILALAFVLSGSCGKGEGLGEEARWQKVLRVGLPVLSLALFAAFYPLIAGTPTTVAYASALKWLPSWTFYIL